MVCRSLMRERFDAGVVESGVEAVYEDGESSRA